MNRVEVVRHVVLRGWVVVLAIPFEEGRKRFFAGVFDGEFDGVVNFVARADAFEWLGGVWVD